MKRFILENNGQVISLLGVTIETLLSKDSQDEQDLFVLMRDGLFLVTLDADLGPSPKIQLHVMVDSNLRNVLNVFDRQDIVYCHKLTDAVHHLTVNRENSFTTYQFVEGYAVSKLLPNFQPEDVGCTYQKPFGLPIAQPWYPQQSPDILARPRFMTEGQLQHQGEVDLSE